MHNQTGFISIGQILILVIGAILAVVTYLTGFSVWIGVVLFICAGLCAFLWRQRSNKSDSQDEAVASGSPAPAKQLDTALESLVPLNLDIRLAIMPELVRSSFEHTIDTLLNLLPKVEEAVPGGELSWVVFRIAEDYLPKRLVQPYLTLSPDVRTDEKVVQDVVTNLEAMQNELHDVDKLLAEKASGEFAAKSTFLKHRFNIN